MTSEEIRSLQPGDLIRHTYRDDQLSVFEDRIGLVVSFYTPPLGSAGVEVTWLDDGSCVTYTISGGEGSFLRGDRRSRVEIMASYSGSNV